MFCAMTLLSGAGQCVALVASCESFNKNSLLLQLSERYLSLTMSASPEGANGANDARDPSGFLSEIIGAPVTVKLNSGVVFKGGCE